ncbi:hypothetical protein ANN_04131 [Periplaneta americana]|uniref:Uncharacterized protein n=1 Tax=Periplaneta americana TaxID=6978 RepID=A0ABQ8T7Q7_PERAM|nr:hypothetical protein ANN_04131 [Periplaneta americana]
MPNVSIAHRLARKSENTGSTENIKSPGLPRSRRLVENVALVRQSVATITTANSYLTVPPNFGTDSGCKFPVLYYFNSLRFLRWLYNDTASTTRLISVDETGDRDGIWRNEAEDSPWITWNSPHGWGKPRKNPTREWDWCPPSIVMNLGSYDMWRNPVAEISYKDNNTEISQNLASVAQTTTCTAAMTAIETSSSFVSISLQRDVIVVHRSGFSSTGEKFPNRWIGRRGAPVCPPRSPDLTSLEFFFFWGFMKDAMYQRGRANTLEELRQRITSAAALLTTNATEHLEEG